MIALLCCFNKYPPVLKIVTVLITAITATDAATAKIKYPMWAGEWSLGTDVCAFWLNGFNDFRDEYAHECAWVDCPYSYLPYPYDIDFDRSLPTIGPFGVSPP